MKLFLMTVMLFMALELDAIDLKVLAGPYMPDNSYVDSSKSLGVEIGGVSTVRENGLNYGLKTGFIAMDKHFDNGSFAYMNLEIIYRHKRNTEMYITAGPLFQNLKNEDYGYGYNGGVGSRYVWCNGFLIGLEFNVHKLKFKSGRAATAKLNGTYYKNYNIYLTLGYRF